MGLAKKLNVADVIQLTLTAVIAFRSFKMVVAISILWLNGDIKYGKVPTN
jgi:hypothetical protein